MTLTLPLDLVALLDAKTPPGESCREVAIQALRRGLTMRKLGRPAATFTGLPDWLAPYEAEVRDASVPLSVIAEKSGRTKPAVAAWRRKVLDGGGK